MPLHARYNVNGDIPVAIDSIYERRFVYFARDHLRVKLFNCFDTIGRNVNKQSRICGPHIFNTVIFLYYFYMH